MAVRQQRVAHIGRATRATALASHAPDLNRDDAERLPTLQLLVGLVLHRGGEEQVLPENGINAASEPASLHARRPAWCYCGGKRAHLLVLTSPPTWLVLLRRQLSWLALLRRQMSSLPCTHEPPVCLALLRRQAGPLACTDEPAEELMTRMGC